MTEILLAVLIFVLAAGGLGLGLALGRGAPRSCGGDRCALGGCVGCPNRAKPAEDG